MHPLEQHYAGGSDYALASFGLEKIAVMSPEQAKAFMAARANRPTGLAAIQAKSTTPILGSIPGASAAGAAAAPVGGPGMAPGFGGGGLPLEAPLGYGEASLKGIQPSRKLPTAMTGAGSIPGQAAQAEMRARAVPTRFNLPDKLAAFLLPTA